MKWNSCSKELDYIFHSADVNLLPWLHRTETFIELGACQKYRVDDRDVQLQLHRRRIRFHRRCQKLLCETRISFSVKGNPLTISVMTYFHECKIPNFTGTAS